MKCVTYESKTDIWSGKKEIYNNYKIFVLVTFLSLKDCKQSNLDVAVGIKTNKIGNKSRTNNRHFCEKILSLFVHVRVFKTYLKQPGKNFLKFLLVNNIPKGL